MKLQRIKSKTKELKFAQKKSKRKIQALKTVRPCSIVMACSCGLLQERSSEYSTSENTRQLINKTFAELELSGKVGFRHWPGDVLFRFIDLFSHVFRHTHLLSGATSVAASILSRF